MVGASLAPGPFSQTPIVDPFGLAGAAGTVASVLSGIGLVLLVASLLAALVCVVLRFRAARGVQRQQLRWIAVGASAR